jgi:mannose-6-phosphate isomerase-like protein (cupin superfamily)
MTEQITVGRAELEYGITTAHEKMDNGELRFRLFGRDGNGYIRTVASTKGAWQNSHSHAAFRELYLVEFGWMAFAWPNPRGSFDLVLFDQGQSYVTPLGQVHNVYLPANAVIHTVKFGIRGPHNRFESAPWFDEHTKPLSEPEILGRGKKHWSSCSDN